MASPALAWAVLLFLFLGSGLLCHLAHPNVVHIACNTDGFKDQQMWVFLRVNVALLMSSIQADSIDVNCKRGHTCSRPCTTHGPT